MEKRIALVAKCSFSLIPSWKTEAEMQGHFDEVSNRYVAFWTRLFSCSGKTVEEKTSLLELQFRPGQKGVLPL